MVLSITHSLENKKKRSNNRTLKCAMIHTIKQFQSLRHFISTNYCYDAIWKKWVWLPQRSKIFYKLTTINIRSIISRWIIAKIHYTILITALNSSLQIQFLHLFIYIFLFSPCGMFLKERKLIYYSHIFFKLNYCIYKNANLVKIILLRNEAEL